MNMGGWPSRRNPSHKVKIRSVDGARGSKRRTKWITHWCHNYFIHNNESYCQKWSVGFPGGAVVEGLPANAGDVGSRPGLGGSHMPRSDWAREPQLLSLRVWSLCSATREAAMVRGPCTAMKSGPCLPQLEESPHTETKTQHNHK